MGVCNCQLLADDKGVYCEVESEGGPGQISALRYTNHIRRNRLDKATTQVEVQRLHGRRSVNMAGRWSES